MTDHWWCITDAGSLMMDHWWTYNWRPPLMTDDWWIYKWVCHHDWQFRMLERTASLQFHIHQWLLDHFNPLNLLLSVAQQWPKFIIISPPGLSEGFTLTGNLIPGHDGEMCCKTTAFWWEGCEKKHYILHICHTFQIFHMVVSQKPIQNCLSKLSIAFLCIPTRSYAFRHKF